MSKPIKPNSIYIKGFLFAGAYNVFGMLLFSKFFTNSMLADVDPAVFSWLGQVSIVLWGLAYASVAKSYRSVPYLIIIFAIEKLVYSLIWIRWILQKGQILPSIAEESLLTAMFYSMYGIGDIIFFIFFSWVAVIVLKNRD